mmetsp:Transcript_19136/g.35668  ORF Transcript_19136/g.35668 Transcript_19136/m.35668 type:complete len:150 (+) Transcript_19136:365-814(+)
MALFVEVSDGHSIPPCLVFLFYHPDYNVKEAHWVGRTTAPPAIYGMRPSSAICQLCLETEMCQLQSASKKSDTCLIVVAASGEGEGTTRWYTCAVVILGRQSISLCPPSHIVTWTADGGTGYTRTSRSSPRIMGKCSHRRGGSADTDAS